MIFVLLLLCHWLGDYTHLSTKDMLAAKRLGKPLVPIWIHACVHGLLSFYVLLLAGSVASAAYGCMIIWFSHFLIDVLKGRMNGWFPTLQNPANVYHWWVFGIDQTLHVLVIFFIYNLSI